MNDEWDIRVMIGWVGSQDVEPRETFQHIDIYALPTTVYAPGFTPALWVEVYLARKNKLLQVIIEKYSFICCLLCLLSFTVLLDCQ